MTRRGLLDQGRSVAFGLALSVTLLGGAVAPRALAQSSAPNDAAPSLSVKPTENKPWWQEKFAGSFVDLTSYVGSGTFYASGYYNPYVSTALFLRPSYKLGTKRELTLNARLYLEEEYTPPDNDSARRFTLLDTWIWLGARNLYTEPASKVRFSGVLRGLIPTSLESRYANVITVLTAGLTANRPFEFGRADSAGKKWELGLSLGTAFSKYLHTSIYRGNGPGDSTGCRAGGTVGASGGAGGGNFASGSDTCGGPLNTNFAFTSTAAANLARGRYSLSASLSVINQIRYAADESDFTSVNAVIRGRSDVTWGILSLGYKINDHLGLSAGLSSYQPAMDSRYRYLRFPFFDFSGTNANNFTQVFVGVNGTL